jgi:methylated-DNA-[protein]-cysteine S-methyltransferase
MKKRDDELIAIVLGDAGPSPQMKRWLGTEEGRRELEAYRRTLGMLNSVYGEVAVSQRRRVVHYTSMRAPVGRLHVAATDVGLVRVSFDRAESAFVDELRRDLRMDVVKSAEKMADVVAQLEAYFAGKRRAFDLPIDERLMRPFQRSVLRAAQTIPAGQLASYGEIARRIGRPRASRAVGQALGHNPMPIVIPCHRVVSSGGGLGGYTGGLQIKKKLLKMEGAYRGA